MPNSFIHSFISLIQTIIYVKIIFLKIPCNIHLHEVIKNSYTLYKSTFYLMCHFFCFFHLCHSSYKLSNSISSSLLTSIHTTNVKNMHLHRDSNPGPWNTVPML